MLLLLIAALVAAIIFYVKGKTKWAFYALIAGSGIAIYGQLSRGA